MVEKPRRDQENPEPSPCMIYVDKEGSWFHKGAPIIHRQLLLLFYQCLSVDERGQYIIKFKDQVCRLDVEDTPFVVLSTDFVSAGFEGDKNRFILHLIDDTKEELAPETLTIGSDHVLYCRIRGGKFRARFSRPSYYQLAQYVDEDPATGRYFVCLNNKKYYLTHDLSK
jgi:hypothetical protein